MAYRKRRFGGGINFPGCDEKCFCAVQYLDNIDRFVQVPLIFSRKMRIINAAGTVNDIEIAAFSCCKKHRAIFKASLSDF